MNAAPMSESAGTPQRARRRGRDHVGFAFWILLSLTVGTVSGFVGQASVETWYRDLLKPGFTPPDAWFGPVWIALYVLMGIAAHLAIREGRRRPEARDRARVARTWFLVQLALNGAWSVLFFGLRSPLIALIEIVALVVAIVFTMKAFARLSKLAARLLVPYLAWVSFATILNGSIWWLNR